MDSEAPQLETYGPLVDAEGVLGITGPGRLRKVLGAIKNISTRVAAVLAGLTAAGAVVAACSGDGSFFPIDGGEDRDEMTDTMPEPPEDMGPEDTNNPPPDAKPSCDGTFRFTFTYDQGIDIEPYLVWPDEATSWNELDELRIVSSENPNPDWGETDTIEDDPFLDQWIDEITGQQISALTFNPTSFLGQTFPLVLYRHPDEVQDFTPILAEFEGCDPFRGVEGTFNAAPAPPAGYYDPLGFLVNAADEEPQAVCFILPQISPIPDTTEEPPSLTGMPDSCFLGSGQDSPLPANIDPIFLQRSSL